mmetsp:Transcript_2828/g.7764  ORF Transcript_2828/g.7764 Transcript_2828/m.7764 type:complete len:145 (-) Transcript_2828:269-703(-)|eukprot:CAMPEP_0197176430 /NCGR_PEP_ID=MMETSP1423-20130617/2371_1 /TAXON_ID=476441 /ORGANISM="Pseudo-nitzschia heimii, Strain UNC1101" /LENGTH=144 /DNA_ID=CAMNT_0042625811 /DNA_START=80 /DNA_END=514 /DNA_ORIENTATION=-
MTNHQEKAQIVSTLYMPSLYDSDEDDQAICATDERDDNACTGVSRYRNSHDIMRCLAWSQAEDDVEDNALSERKEKNEDDVMFLIQDTSCGCASFNSIHSAIVDSTHCPTDSNTKNIHWVERVASDNNLDSLLSRNSVSTSLSQ